MQEIINRAKELLADGTVVRVLGWRIGDLPYNPEPSYFETAEDLEANFVYNGFCGANLSKYMIEGSKLEGKTLVFLKPCDTYSFNQLIKENRVVRDKAYIIGIGCKGKLDVEKIKAQGIAAVQINTGGACHLESAMIKRAVDVLDLERLDLIIVENVGNLVCPTDFDLGENAKVMILSVPEGDDKPLKYPGVFQVAEAVVLNKVDTMPVFNFDREAFEAAVTQLNPQAPIFPIAATKGDGVDAWAEWLANRIRAV